MTRAKTSTALPPDWTGAACLGVRGFHDTAPDSIERALALCNGTDTTESSE